MKNIIMFVIVLMIGCARFNSVDIPNNSTPYGFTENISGIVFYRFKLIPDGYCLKTIKLSIKESMVKNAISQNQIVFYDNRIKNHTLIENDNRFEYYFGDKSEYIYNTEKPSSVYNLRNTELLMDHNTLRPYYSTTCAYKSMQEDSSSLIVAFNFRGTVNWYFNYSKEFEADLLAIKDDKLDTILNCYRANFMSSTTIISLNKCDSVWPLSAKDEQRINLLRSPMDSLHYGFNY